jgi:hypothetical protein
MSPDDAQCVLIFQGNCKKSFQYLVLRSLHTAGPGFPKELLPDQNNCVKHCAATELLWKPSLYCRMMDGRIESSRVST